LGCLQLALVGWRKDFPDLVVNEVQLPICYLSLCDEALCLLCIWPRVAWIVFAIHVLGHSRTG
jgi:hypothetical protein